MLLDGKAIRNRIEETLKLKIRNFKEVPCLVVIMVGNNTASEVYVRNKLKACERVGIKAVVKKFPETITEKELLEVIVKENSDPKVNGLLVQLPLPVHIDRESIMSAIDPVKDVDGLTTENMGKLARGLKGIVPATPKGIIRLLDEYQIPLSGKKALVIGKSNLVGKPTALLLMQRDATVSVAHIKTTNLDELARNADIIVTAAGAPNLLTSKNVSKGVVIVDVSTNLYEAKIVGDVDFPSVNPLAKYISPVPGGVGPMTIASLLENVVECFEEQNK